MKKRGALKFSLFTFLLSLSFDCLASQTPNQRALEMAQRQTHLTRLLQTLRKEVRRIQDPTFRKDGEAMIHHPKFLVIDAHRPDEMQILDRLKKEGLYDGPNEKGILFPSRTPTPFLAAPGAPWGSHHSYPGGLAYHTLTNLLMGSHYAQVYQQVYQAKMRPDIIRFAALWHDLAKTVTLAWNEDGSCTPAEVQIAGTSAHHTLGIAEAIYRKYPSEFVVTLASAHSPPQEGKPLTQLIAYLKAGSILAKAPLTSAGLTSDGTTLASLPPVEAFINHLADHDYVLTESTLSAIDSENKKSRIASPKKVDSWKRNEELSKQGDLQIYQQMRQANLQPSRSSP